MKRKNFHCQNCGNECTIYKKGKAHRVLVCPECGVIATNPSVLGKVAKKTGKGLLRSIPIVGDIGAEFLTKDANTPQKKTLSSPTIGTSKSPYSGKYSLDKIKLAMGAK